MTLPEPSPTPNLASLPERSRLDLWLEVLVVCAFAAFPSYYSYVESWIWPSEGAEPSSLQDSAGFIAVEVPVIGLVLYLLWRARERWGTFGLGRPRWAIDLVVCLILFGLHYAMSRQLFAGFDSFWNWMEGLPGPGEEEAAAAASPEAPEGFKEQAFLVASTLLSTFSEELVFRAYLITRLSVLLGRSTIALVVSAALFGGCHLYQGVEGTMHATLMGLVYGFTFLRWRSLWPLAASHAAYNLALFLCPDFTG